jgi:hypothetical protein
MATWLGPVLGLLGVVVTTAAGYYQWRRTSRKRREASYHARRARVLEELLAKLDGLQIVSRRGTISQDALDAQARGLNEFLIAHGTVLDDAVRAHARQYLAALVELHTSARSDASFREEIWLSTNAAPTAQTPGPDWARSAPASFQRMASAEHYLQEQIRRSWGSREPGQEQ